MSDESWSEVLSFENVTTNGQGTVLKDVEATIEPGQIVGVIGATGGKSTLTVFPHLFDPQERLSKSVAGYSEVVKGPCIKQCRS